MDTRGVQRLLAAAGYYGGGIDGAYGPKTATAVDKIIEKHRQLCVADPAGWSAQRRMIAAGQIILTHAGFEPGTVDGLAGHNTEEAFNAWDYEKTNGTKEVVPRPIVSPPAAAPAPTKGKFLWPKQVDCKTFYGDPEKNTVEKNLVVIDLPYQMRIDWDLAKTTSKMSIHTKCADSVVGALKDVLAAYGLSRIKALGLDRFAGSYNKRKMRGGDNWSMHAYGCAIDFYAGPNGLRVPAPTALFSGENYKTFFDIWESYGWVSLGRAINRDWMHVQAARL